VGRRNRDLQHERRRAASASRTPARPRGGSPVTRYLIDLVGIFAIAVVLNFALYEIGVLNSVLRILIGIVVGRLVMTFGRRFLEGRIDSRGGAGR